jgi:hypothetical protein
VAAFETGSERRRDRAGVPRDERRHRRYVRFPNYLEWAEKNERVVVHADDGAVAAALED